METRTQRANEGMKIISVATPTASFIPAQGNALGSCSAQKPALKARFIGGELVNDSRLQRLLWNIFLTQGVALGWLKRTFGA
jgi:hypothetical protein